MDCIAWFALGGGVSGEWASLGEEDSVGGGGRGAVGGVLAGEGDTDRRRGIGVITDEEPANDEPVPGRLFCPNGEGTEKLDENLSFVGDKSEALSHWGFDTVGESLSALGFL